MAWFQPIAGSPAVKFRIEGNASGVDLMLKNFAGALGDMSSLMERVRQEISQEVSDIFQESASGRKHPWQAWSGWTISWRASPPMRTVGLEVAEFTKKKQKQFSSSGSRPF